MASENHQSGASGGQPEGDSAPRCRVHRERLALGPCQRCGQFLCGPCQAAPGMCGPCWDRLHEDRAVKQLPVLAILLMTHGVAVTAMGGIFCAYGVSLWWQLQDLGATPGPTNDNIFQFVGPSILLVGLVQVLPGLFQSVAGWRLFHWHGRGFGMASLVSGLLTLVTCYCFPTSLILLAWGIYVLSRPDLAERFRLATDGARTRS